MNYDPTKRITPHYCKTLDEIKAMLHDENFARVKLADRNRLKASATRYGYKWSWTKDGGYYIVRMVVK